MVSDAIMKQWLRDYGNMRIVSRVESKAHQELRRGDTIRGGEDAGRPDLLDADRWETFRAALQLPALQLQAQQLAGSMRPPETFLDGPVGLEEPVGLEATDTPDESGMRNEIAQMIYNLSV